MHTYEKLVGGKVALSQVCQSIESYVEKLGFFSDHSSSTIRSSLSQAN